MTITSLVENTSREDFPVEHGLSLHIRLEDGRQILFDMGQGNLFARNAEHLGIRLSEVKWIWPSYHTAITTTEEASEPFWR